MRTLSLCRGKDGITYHLFEGKLEDNEECRGTGPWAICRKEDRENNTCLKECRPENEMRSRVADLANQGEQICGICVSSMYKNN